MQTKEKTGKKSTQKDQYVCDVCGATSDKPQECCGQPMRKKTQK